MVWKIFRVNELKNDSAELDVAARRDRAGVRPAKRGPRRTVVDAGVEQRTKLHEAGVDRVGVEVESERRIVLDAVPVPRLEVLPRAARQIAEALDVRAKRLRDDPGAALDEQPILSQAHRDPTGIFCPQSVPAPTCRRG